MKVWKKFLSGILSALLLVGILPTSALAAHAPIVSEGNGLAKEASLFINQTEVDTELSSMEASSYQFPWIGGYSDYAGEDTYLYVVPITPNQETAELYAKARVTMSDPVARQLGCNGENKGQYLDVLRTKFIVLIAIDENMTLDTDSEFLFNSTFLMPDAEQMNKFATANSQTANIQVNQDTEYTSPYSLSTATDMRWEISGNLDALFIPDSTVSGATCSNITEKPFNNLFDNETSAYYNYIGEQASQTTSGKLNQAWEDLVDTTGTVSDIPNMKFYAIPVKMNWSALIEETDTERINELQLYKNFTMADWSCPMELSVAKSSDSAYEGLGISVNLQNCQTDDELHDGINNYGRYSMAQLPENDIDSFVITPGDITYNASTQKKTINTDSMPIAGAIYGSMWSYKTDTTGFGQDGGYVRDDVMQPGHIYVQFAYATPGAITVTKTIEGLTKDDESKLPKNLAITITDQNGNLARDLNGEVVNATLGDKWEWDGDTEVWKITQTVEDLRPSDDTYGWDYQYEVAVGNGEEETFEGYKQTQKPTYSAVKGEDPAKNGELELKNQYTLTRNEDGTVGYSEDATGEQVTVTVKSKYKESAPEPATVTLTYDANGGSEQDVTKTYDENASVTVEKNMFTYDGHTFKNWNTKADGTGTPYAADATFNITANTTLYAQWTEDVVWDGSEISKTATNLDRGYESNITLSLPAAGYQKEVDVVFAIDCTSVLESSGNKMIAAISELADQLEDKNQVNLNVGVVAFGNEAKAITELIEVTDKAEYIETVSKSVSDNSAWFSGNDGTNIQLGIRTAKGMLDNSSTGSKAENRYLVLMTDGGGFWYCNEAGESANKLYNGGYIGALGNADANGDVGTINRETRFTKSANFAEFMEKYGSEIEASVEPSYSKDALENPTDAMREEALTNEDIRSDAYILNMERGTYLAAKELESVKTKGYNIITLGYSYRSKDNLPTLQGIANGFLGWTDTVGRYYDENADISTAFAGIANELSQYVDAGSKVVDVIGSGKDNHDNEYNFDFVNNIENLTLTVNKQELDKTLIAENTYGFGPDETLDEKYKFILTYYANGQDGQSDECFVLDINVPVTLDAPVQFKYTVELTNPQGRRSSTMTYGRYDEDGSEKYDSLKTNNSATLYPVSSEGDASFTPVEFPEPTVSYTVRGSGNGGNVKPPQLETGDHFAYVMGYPDEMVKPYNNITRAEVATIFFRLLTEESRNEYYTTTNDFTDVSEGMWFNNAISTLSNAEIINGYQDGSFQPDKSITRAELAAIAARFDELSEGESQFSDISGHWAEELIESAYNKGWVGGYPDGTFRPDQAIIRAEVMTLINRVLNRHVDEEGMLEDMITWPDNTPDMWCYEAVQEATNSHDYTRDKGEILEDWIKINPPRDWGALENPTF